MKPSAASQGALGYCHVLIKEEYDRRGAEHGAAAGLSAAVPAADELDARAIDPKSRELTKKHPLLPGVHKTALKENLIWAFS